MIVSVCIDEPEAQESIVGWVKEVIDVLKVVVSKFYLKG